MVVIIPWSLGSLQSHLENVPKENVRRSKIVSVEGRQEGLDHHHQGRTWIKKQFSPRGVGRFWCLKGYGKINKEYYSQTIILSTSQNRIKRKETDLGPYVVGISVKLPKNQI